MGNALNGVVVRGLGEGAYFMSMQRYKKEIKNKLGFDAYPGTLNIKVGKKQRDLLKDFDEVIIEGFKQKNKAFGGADCYRAKIKNITGAVIIPHLTKHRDMIEFIAPVHLKSVLKLRDGNKIKVELI